MNTSDQKMKTLPTTLLPTWFHDFNVNNMGKLFVLYFLLTNCFFYTAALLRFLGKSIEEEDSEDSVSSHIRQKYIKQVLIAI